MATRDIDHRRQRRLRASLLHLFALHLGIQQRAEVLLVIVFRRFEWSCQRVHEQRRQINLLIRNLGCVGAELINRPDFILRRAPAR
jgi:hypothetical protein